MTVALNSANMFLIQAFADFEKYMQTNSFQPELDGLWEGMITEIRDLEAAAAGL